MTPNSPLFINESNVFQVMRDLPTYSEIIESVITSLKKLANYYKRSRIDPEDEKVFQVLILRPCGLSKRRPFG